MIKTGIYKITNLINGKIYVGSAVNINNRWLVHKRHLLLNKHHSKKLQNSYNKHGIDSFEFKIIEECDKEKLLKIEQHYIDLHNTVKDGYNCNPIAGNSLGRKMSDATKLKLRFINLGKTGANKGKKMSIETKEKISNSKKGKPSNRKGIKHTKKSKIKMSILRKGIKWNPNFKHHSEETKKILSEIGKTKTGRNSSRYKSIKIIQYDLNDNFIKEWNDLISLREAGLKSANVSCVCRGKQKSAFGYKWRFKI